MLTAAHVVEGAVSVRVRFEADRSDEWVTRAISCWTDPRSDLAVLSIAPRAGESPVVVARWGRIGDRAAVLGVQAVGFPRFKLKTGDGSVFRDSHQAGGSVAVLSNRRAGTLEVTVPPPERDPDPEVSPWEGMSGAAVWVGDRIVGVIAEHHRSDGLGRLAAARLDRALEGLDPSRRAELGALIDLPDVVPDVVPPSAGGRVTTAYQAQVRDIAPDRLLDREEELDELVGFCAGDQPYAWWQAGPWAGKSALMAWFVLHPPAGVDVVSFFVTARLVGQSDSDACLDALIEQLAALLGESPAGLLTAGARRGTMLRLLEDAASRSREAGRRLLLVIDGLDEDSGTGFSIAALLPRRPPPEVRVLVASRPHPPIPDDVTDDHPLRTITSRQLDVSVHARDVERRAKHELKQLLAGEHLQRDVLGLITAAGGGLTLGDLEQLTERPPFEIEHLLGGVFGRSVGSRTPWRSGGYLDEQVYLFTHETLRLVAEQQYGASLAAYRDRLHRWADTYRQWGWPEDTPHYLRRSYPRMLASIGDLPRLVACATDQVRHDRMRDLTGGDALAFTEISSAQQLILAQPDPDLTSLARLAVQREHLTKRNTNIPVELPAVWAMLGQPIRAESLAKGLPDPAKRAMALTQLARVAAASGDHDRAARLLDEAERLIEQISDPGLRAGILARLTGEIAAGGNRERAEALVAEITSKGLRAGALALLAEVAAAGGEHDWAEALVAEITDPGLRAGALAWLAEAAATGGDHDRAARLTSAAEALTTQVTRSLHAEVSARLARVAAAGGNHDRAARLVDEAEQLVGEVIGRGPRAGELGRLARTEAALGDRDRAARLVDEAERLIAQISDPSQRAEALARLAESATASGDHKRGAVLLMEVTSPGLRAKALARFALAAATAGNHDRAARLVDEAERLVAQISDRSQRATELTRLAVGVAVVGDHERAEGLAAQISDPDLRAGAFARLAWAAAVRGDHDKAEALVVRISEPILRAEALSRLPGGVAAGWDLDEAETLVAQLSALDQRARALTWLAEAAAAGGDHDRATRLTAAAEALTEQAGSRDLREAVLARLAVVVGAGGDQDKAEALIAQISPPGPRAEALARLATRAAAGGDHDWATRLIDAAESLVAQVPMFRIWRAWTLARLAEAVVIGGDHDRAETLIEQITEPDPREEALGRFAEAVAASGDHNRAEALIARISDPNRRASALARVAVTLVEANQETPPAREHTPSRSPLMVRARRLAAEALVTSSWTEVVDSLARVDPLALRTLADELQLRWGETG